MIKLGLFDSLCKDKSNEAFTEAIDRVRECVKNGKNPKSADLAYVEEAEKQPGPRGRSAAAARKGKYY